MNGLAAVGVEVPVALEGASRVRADPDIGRDDLGIESSLDCDGGLDCRLRAVEGGEEAVPRLLDHLAAAVDDSVAEQLVVPGEQPLPLHIAECFQEPGRADDVREDERAACLLAAEKLLDALLVDLRYQTLERGERRLELDRCGVL